MAGVEWSERRGKLTKQEQARIIMEEVNEEFTIPGYMEDDVIRGILKGLTRIEKEGRAYEETVLRG